MKIHLSPIRSDQEIVATKSGDSLIINGELFDFSPMGDGDTLPAEAINSPWFPADVEKQDDELILTLLFPIPRNFSPEQAFPVPIEDVPDGEIAFPQPLSAINDQENIEEQS
jgi:hypothetical protein